MAQTERSLRMERAARTRAEQAARQAREAATTAESLRLATVKAAAVNLEAGKAREEELLKQQAVMRRALSAADIGTAVSDEPSYGRQIERLKAQLRSKVSAEEAMLGKARGFAETVVEMQARVAELEAQAETRSRFLRQAEAEASRLRDDNRRLEELLRRSDEHHARQLRAAVAPTAVQDAGRPNEPGPPSASSECRPMLMQA